MADAADLFRQYRDNVYRLALSYTRSPQEAEDVSQAVFLKLLEQPSITPGKEKAWLMQVTANECRSLLRSAWWKRTAPLEECTAVAPEGSGILQQVLELPPQIPGGDLSALLRMLHHGGNCQTAENQPDCRNHPAGPGEAAAQGQNQGGLTYGKTIDGCL